MGMLSSMGYLKTGRTAAFKKNVVIFSVLFHPISVGQKYFAKCKVHR